MTNGTRNGGRSTDLRLLLLGVLVLATLTTGGWIAWQWAGQVTLDEIRIEGHLNATAEEIREAMRVDSGAVLLDMDAALLEDRIVRHPWIREVDVNRLPSGVLAVRVDERTPVALLMTPTGRMAYWVDAEGWRLPVTERARYDVPLVYAMSEPWHPMRPVQHEPTRRLLRELGAASDRLDALFSEFVWDGDGWTVHLTPAPPHGSIPVVLGAEGFALKFDMLLAFWDQQVLQHANKIFDRVDLRFDSQVVVEERPRQGYAIDTTNNNNE
jgi:cell division protein FtsQ